MQKSRLSEFIKNPNRSLIVLSMPIIAASIIETLYNVVDAIFVGRLGAEALAAVTFAWPFFFILVALNLGINAGVNSRISRFIGERNKKQAENTAMHGLLVGLIASLILIAIGIPLLKPLFSLSGASGNVLNLAVIYMFIILLGTGFMFLSYIVSGIFASQGDTKTSMKIDAYSLVLNIILAPLFIYVFHWGVPGAAIATSVSAVYAFILALYYMKKSSYLKLNFKSFNFSPSILKEIIFVGFPSTIMLLIVSFYVIFLNKAMVHFSIDHVAAFGIVSRLESVATLPIYGLSVGAMTLAGMFYGAKKYKLLNQISWYSIRISVLLTSIVGIIFFIIPGILIRIFTNDLSVINVGIPYMRLDVFTFPLMAVSMIISRIIQALGLGAPGLIINVVRVLVVAVPLAYLFVFVLGLGYLSIAIAMILGGVLATLMGIIWLKNILKANLAK